MASATMTPPQAQQSPMSTAPPVRPGQQERSPSVPLVKDPDTIKSEFGMTSDSGLEQTFLECWREHKMMWADERDRRVQRALRAIEYDNGNQYISWDPSSGRYINPFSDMIGGSVFDQQGQRVYNKVNNVCQWARKITVATLTRAIPHVEWQPGDSESDLDNRTAKAKSQASRKIGRDNHEDEMLELAVEYLFNTGSYFRHIYWSMDERVTGTQMQPEMGMQNRPVLPARYTCPQCGQDTPAPPMPPGQEPPPVQCLQCGAKLGSAYFHPGVSMPMPVVVGQREVPIGAVQQDIWNLLNVNTMPNVDTSKGSVIVKLPLLDLECEITRGAFRTMYPGAWDYATSANPESGAQDSGASRDARFKATSPTLVASMAMSDRMPTYHRLWVTEEFCRMTDDKEKADQLTEIVTKDGREKGCCAVILNDKIIDIQHSDMTKCFTWAGTKRAAGTYPPAIIEPGLDIQDTINDRSNSADEYHDRLGCPPILFNETMISSGLSGKFLGSGTMLGVPVNQDMGRTMEGAFFQPKFQMDNGVYEWIQSRLMFFQLLIGCQPQTFGGSDPNIQTKGGQEQALGTAMQILMLTLKQVRRETANASELSVDCLTANSTGDIKSVVQSDEAVDYKTELIKLADLKAGKASAYPEAAEGYPIDYEEQRQLYKELVLAAKDNPIIGEVLASYEAQRMAMRYLGPPDLELPTKNARDKVLRDLGELAKGQPMPSVDPTTGQQVMMPSVLPDKDVDGPTISTVSIPLTINYILKNYELAQTNPPVFENLKAYLRICKQFDMMQQEQAAMAAAPPQDAPPPTQ